MFYIAAIVFAVLWLLGVFTTYTIIGLLEIVLVAYILVALLRAIGQRNTS